MKRPLLWNQPWVVALGAALGMAVLWVGALRLTGMALTPNSYLTSTSFGVTAVILTFAFLLRVPTGMWWGRFLKEVGILGVSVALVLALTSLVGWLTPSGLLERVEGQNIIGIVFVGSNFLTMTIFALGLSSGSHAAVRAFGHLYVVWSQMRRRRLLWEITHIQLRMVVVIGVLLMVAMVITLLLNAHQIGSPWLVGALTNLTIMAGVVGILTGLGMIALLIPSSLLSISTARRITRRLDHLIEATTALRGGAYHTRVEVDGQDEIAHLQTDFNEMATTLEQALTDLRAERDAVTALLESRRQLFAGVSHELRTPVATVRSFLDSLRRSADMYPDLKDDLDTMQREVLRLQRLIDDVFTLARTETEQLRLEIEPVDVGAVAERVMSAVKHRAWQIGRIDILLEYTPQVPLALVDETRLEQILHNLLRNAVRHTLPGGLVALVIEPEPTMIRIDVKDTGEGIPAEELPRIWERFYRSPGARATDRDGTGLGLALVKELTEAMGGSVSAESLPGQGSTFTIRLPRAQPQQA